MAPSLFPGVGGEREGRMREMGCVGGIFQAFSRHRLRPGRRLAAAPYRPPSPGPFGASDEPGPPLSPSSPSTPSSSAYSEPRWSFSPESMAGPTVEPENRRPTGLVAKLMGLDAMPAIALEKGLRRTAPVRLPVEIAPWKPRNNIKAQNYVLQTAKPPPTSSPPSPPPPPKSPKDQNRPAIMSKSIEGKREKRKPRPLPPPKQAAKARQRKAANIGVPAPKKKPIKCRVDDVSVDQPSPVSVLHAPFQNDDHLSSPSCKNTLSFKGPELDLQKKFDFIDDLLQKLRKIGCDGTGDHIALICENHTPEHRYVSEVLLSSGLLMDLTGNAATPMAIQLARSCPVNSDLFLVLEQTRYGGYRDQNPEKIKRRLLFDLVNEVLRRKIESPPPWLIKAIGDGDEPPGRKLTREICSEIDGFWHSANDSDDDGDRVDQILREETDRRWRWWVVAGDEVDGMVLDIERFVFKNLIDEVLAGESFFLHCRPGFQRRLFSQ